MSNFDFFLENQNKYNPLLDKSLSPEERQKYVYDPPKSDEQKRAERQKIIRDESAKAANLNQYLQNGMSLEEQEREVMKKYAPYLGPKSTETHQFAETKMSTEKDPVDAPQIRPYTDEQLKQMQTDPGAAMLYTGTYNTMAYNPYAGYCPQPNMMVPPPQGRGYTFDEQQAMMQQNAGVGFQQPYYQPQPQMMYSQQPYGYGYYPQPQVPQGYGPNPYMLPPTYNGYGYAYQGGFTPQMYQQYMAEEQQRRNALMNEQMNIWALLMSGARTAQGINSTPEQVKQEILEPPHIKMKKYYESRKVKIKTPGIRVMRGDEVLVARKAEVIEYTGEKLFKIEKQVTDMQVVAANAIPGNINSIIHQNMVSNYLAQRQQKYPKDMTIEQFWEHYGSEMYQEVINDNMAEQQKKVIGLYNPNEFTNLLRGFMKRVNPYGYNIMQNAFLNTNNGYIDMGGPVNVNDLEVSLPNHLKSEADRRRAEFFSRLVGGNSQVPVSGP